MAGLQKGRMAVFCLAVCMMLPASAAFAQRFNLFGDGTGYEPPTTNVPYDGKFTFARIKYTPCCGQMGFYYRGLPAWAHGYVPMGGRGATGRAEANLMKIMDEISYLRPHTDGSNVYAFDDPQLFHYPIAFLVEPGFWQMNDKELLGFRAYLQKGGFLIVDDFRADGDMRAGQGWANLEGNVRRAFPWAQLIPMNPSMVVFDSFFKIESFDVIPQDYDRDRPQFFGLFENNDPTKRLMMIINYSTDVSNFWEFAATGLRPIEDSNQAYKLGVNYIMYGITH